MNKILVLGGTGMLGGPVARKLLADGFEVRLLARDPKKALALLGSSVEIVPGDVTDSASLEIALYGCDGVHISIAGQAELPAAQNVAALSPGLGLQRITYISGATACRENTWFPMTAQKLEAERVIRACEVEYSIFCPTWPLEQLPRLARGGKPLLIGDKVPAYHWFAAADLARMVSAAYQSTEAANGRFYIHGPEALGMRAAMERYCRAFHPEVDSVPIMPTEVARSTAASTGSQMLAFFAELMAYFEKAGEPGDPSQANELHGAPRTTLEAWIGQTLAVHVGR